jgi:hypothetical protein
MVLHADMTAPFGETLRFAGAARAKCVEFTSAFTLNFTANRNPFKGAALPSINWRMSTGV